MAEPTEMYGEYKVLPNEGSLLIGMSASAILGLLFLGAAGWWKGISVLLAGVFVVCFYQLYWPRLIIRANREGLYLSIGTFGRPLLRAVGASEWRSADQGVVAGGRG